jgi:N-hydroxyarylamine O-acetyltransferase
MNNLNKLFRKRIGLDENEKITFDMLGDVLEKTALSIPFENLCIIANEINEVNREYLINKILVKNEGGLCYELNSILYLFLQENGFNVSLVTGVVFNQADQIWSKTGRTHAAILQAHEGEIYLIDTGFGSNLPLKPVPLNGEIVTSATGEFRVSQLDSEHGNYKLEIKLKHKDQEWRTGYAFDSINLVKNLIEMNVIQKTITESHLSSFNKHPLLTKLTTNGSLTLTNTSITLWIDGVMRKEIINENQFKELMKQHFLI